MIPLSWFSNFVCIFEELCGHWRKQDNSENWQFNGKFDPFHCKVLIYLIIHMFILVRFSIKYFILEEWNPKRVIFINFLGWLNDDELIRVMLPVEGRKHHWSTDTLYVVEHIITLVVNGSATTVLTSVEPYNWNDTEDTNLFIGRSTSTYFSGFIDDVSARINNNHVMATN